METEGRLVLADFEAGLGTLSRLKPGQVDLFLVVTAPTAKAVEVARRALEMIREKDVGRAQLVANRIASDEDRELLQSAFGAAARTEVPEDASIREADVRGVAVFDHAPDTAATRAIRKLAESLLA